MGEDTLASIAVDFFADTARLDAQMAGIIADAQDHGARAGAAFGVGFGNRLMNAVAGLNSFLGGARTVVGMLGEASGSNTAAEFGYLRRQIQGITGDVQVANRYFDRLQRLAADTNFDLADVFSLTTKIGGRTGNIGQAVADTQNIVDAATTMGVRNQDFGRFQINLGQSLSRGDRKTSVVDLQQYQNYAPQLVSQIAKTYGITVQDAFKKVTDSTGNEVYQMILEVGRRNRGAAARAAGEDPQSVGRNLVDDFRAATEPTGRLINTLLVPPLQALRGVTQDLGGLNKATGGLLWLFGMIGGGYLLMRRFGGGLAEAASATWRLTNAVQAYTSAANRGAGGAGGPGGMSGMSAADRAARTTQGIEGVAWIAGLAAIYGASRINANGEGARDSNLNITKRALERIGTYAPMGVSFGARFGPWGAALGGLAGAGIGIGGGQQELTDRQFGAGSYLRTLAPFLNAIPFLGPTLSTIASVAGIQQGAAARGGASTGPGGAQNANTQALEKLTNKLEQIKSFTSIGGGDRLRGALRGAELESQYTLLRAMNAGIG